MVEKKELSKGVRIPLIFVTIVSAIAMVLFAFMSYNNPQESRKKMNDTVIFFTVTSLLSLIAGILILTLTKNKEEKKEENKEVEKD